jgi:thiamine pyrophosphate-dependent acetolactate synthase large subunit-like protein
MIRLDQAHLIPAPEDRGIAAMTPPQSATARANNADPAVAGVERPTPAGANAPGFGSDIIADALRALDVPYIALTPGASYRGLHDSIVNYLGNTKPQMLLCLHEEAAVAIAQGYAKVTDKAMVTAVHSNVGLMHASMALFNAWCDRTPVVVLGATGPVDAAKRRPWIDWIHTARDQGALVREYTKWDDQPASPAAAREAILRGTWIANTVPQGPVYINFDAELQEMKVNEPLPAIDVARYMPAIATAAPPELVKQAAAMLKGAKQVLILAGRASRSEEAWNARVALAEALGARVVTDLKIGATFPTDHPLYAGAPRAISADSVEGLKNVDVILSLDWVDLAGALRSYGPSPSVKVIQVSLDHRIHNGWSMDHQGLPPVDLLLSADPDLVVPELVKEVGKSAKPHAVPSARTKTDKEPAGFTNEHIARSLKKVLGDRPVTYTHLPLSWDDSWATFKHPLDYIGSDGGGGVGGGPGISVGAALALKGTGRLPVAICGDGDFLMGVTAVWTAVHYKIPLLFVLGFGPVTKPADLAPILEKAIAEVEAGKVAVVDVRVEPGYTAIMTQAMTRAGN